MLLGQQCHCVIVFNIIFILVILISMLSAGCPSSLLSLLSRMSVLVLLLSRTKRPKGNLSPSVPPSTQCPPHTALIRKKQLPKCRLNISLILLVRERLDLQ